MSLGRELAARLPQEVDTVVVPIGGGGLAAGLIRGMQEAGRSIQVVGAEPGLANDAAALAPRGIYRRERQ